MVNLTYHGKTLLAGPQNYFKLTTGVQPSFGFFRMLAADVEYILTTQSGVAGDLVLSDGTNTVTLHNIYLVKATSISALTNTVYDVILADERILWQYTYGSANYNTYKTDRTTGTEDDEFEFENLNGEDEWTFTELRDILKTLLDITTLTFTSPTRKPRNIIGENISGVCLLQQFLIAAQSYITCDPQSSPTVYDILTIGETETEEDITLFTTYASYLHKQHTIQINPLVQKGLAVEMLAAANPDEAPGRLLGYGDATATGGTGKHLIPSAYAVFNNEENSEALETIGDEMAATYAESFANTWRDNTYAAILPFKLNRAVHEITWQVNAQGALTRVKSFRPREELNIHELQDTLFTYHKYLLGAGVGTSVHSAKIQTDGIPADNVGPFVCKLIDADGNVTGDPIDVWPCDHLGSAPFDSLDVWPHFLVNDYMSIFKDLDGKWYTTFVFDDKLFMARGCRIQTGGVPGNNAGPFVCKLLDADALEFGDNINVWPSQHLGTSVFDGGNVHPNFAAGDYMTISKDADGEWYTTFVFEDTVPCICFGS